MAHKSLVSILKHQIAELQRLILGAKIERFKSASDLMTGNHFELPQIEPIEKPVEEITYTHSKPESRKQPFRLELPAHLPRQKEIIEPENLPSDAKKISVAITEVLYYEPTILHIHRIVHPKYIISTNDEQAQTFIADLPTLPIPKGNAGDRLPAHILISKFVNHFPFYRQIQML